MTGLIVLFLLGIANFAIQRAVFASGHPLLAQLPQTLTRSGGRAVLVAEFLILLGAMLLVENGFVIAAWGYAFYVGLNATSAWLLLSGRI